MIKLIGKFLCSIGRHDLEYLPPPEGIMRGIFGPCKCKRCSYKHDGFPYPSIPPRPIYKNKHEESEKENSLKAIVIDLRKNL